MAHAIISKDYRDNINALKQTSLVKWMAKEADAADTRIEGFSLMMNALNHYNEHKAPKDPEPNHIGAVATAINEILDSKPGGSAARRRDGLYS